MIKSYTLFCWLFVTSIVFGQTTEIGQKAPEIAMNSFEGKLIKLSSLKGQMVLIDFWASWCAPCRKENPYLVKSYKKYSQCQFKNAIGFTIFGVSLDMKQPAWEKAIQTDSLIWPYHVSDLKGWRNEAALLYGVKSIPANFLIDGEGVIIGKNLRGDELDELLKKQQKKSWFSALFE